MASNKTVIDLCMPEDAEKKQNDFWSIKVSTKLVDVGESW